MTAKLQAVTTTQHQLNLKYPWIKQFLIYLTCTLLILHCALPPPPRTGNEYQETSILKDNELPEYDTEKNQWKEIYQFKNSQVTFKEKSFRRILAKIWKKKVEINKSGSTSTYLLGDTSCSIA